MCLFLYLKYTKNYLIFVSKTYSFKIYWVNLLLVSDMIQNKHGCKMLAISHKGYTMTIHSKTFTPLFPLKTTWDIDWLREAGIYTWFKEIQEELPNGWVKVNNQEMLMLGGYSYLGLNQNQEINQAAINSIKKFGTGMSGSRFLAGTTTLHSRLEQKIAHLHGKEDAMVLSSGYLANVSTIVCLLKKNDYIVCDKLNHASIMDGARYAQAKFVRYRHNDPEHLDATLSKIPHSARKLVITDSVFSMSGTVANLPEIIKVCKKHEAILMVDECHSMFVLGENGGGIVEYFDIDPDDIDIIMATLSKAIPSSGGYLAASAKIIDYLRHESRGFIYSGALTSTLTATALKALEIFEEERENLVKRLHENTVTFSNTLRSYGIDIGHSETSIVPILIGDTTRAAIAAKKCQENGLYIHAVFPPVVPVGKSILRASITAAHQKKDLVMAARKIYEILEDLKHKNAQSILAS